MGTRSIVSFELLSRCLESSLRNWTSVTTLTKIRGVAEADRNHTVNWVKLTRTVILKKSVLSASTVPFTAMLPVFRSMANNPSSLPDSERKKKNELESYPLVRILKSTYFARWFDTLKSITCSISLTWPNGVSISLNILELDRYIINYLSWRFKNLTDWRMERKKCVEPHRTTLLQLTDPSYFYVVVI